MQHPALPPLISSWARQIAEKAIEYNRVAYMCFVDVTKAVDRVRLTDVVELKKKNVHRDISSIVAELNTNNWTEKQLEGRETHRLPKQTEIRQGDSLSPILFNLIMDELIAEVSKVGKGYSLGDKKLKVICYADDAALVSEGEENLQGILYRFEKTATKYSMEKLVMSFKYLGVNITSSRDLQEDYPHSRDESLRPMAGYTLRDHKGNEDIRELCDVQDILRWSRNRCRQLKDHIERMDNNILEKIARDGLPTSSRPPGRPPIRKNAGIHHLRYNSKNTKRNKKR
ncbi:hypothetical protein HUJ04_008390 [Dendroctonus ponderosae]|nr:hypothetical protein HUJ04_008390 [Dendroctonus ponderosae]